MIYWAFFKIFYSATLKQCRIINLDKENVNKNNYYDNFFGKYFSSKRFYDNI